MKPFQETVNRVINESDIVIIVLDSRFVQETRNRPIEEKIRRKRKEIIYVLNKSDLLKERFEDIKLNLHGHAIFVSAVNNLGTTKLRNILKEYKKRPLIVGVIGYPNTGKSSLINALKQRKSAGTSPIAGFTRGMQKIKVARGIYLFDTPGVFPRLERDELKHSLISAKDPNRVEDPDIIASQIIEIIIKKDKKILENLYKIKIKSEDPQEILEQIAIASNWLIKGGLPNIDLTAKKIITDWQKGKISIEIGLFP